VRRPCSCGVSATPARPARLNGDGAQVASLWSLPVEEDHPQHRAHRRGRRGQRQLSYQWTKKSHPHDELPLCQRLLLARSTSRIELVSGGEVQVVRRQRFLRRGNRDGEEADVAFIPVPAARMLLRWHGAAWRPAAGDSVLNRELDEGRSLP
jgi:hypothetical protein